MEAKATTLAKKSLDSRKMVELPTSFVPKFWADADRRIALVKLILNRIEQIKADAGGEESVQRDLLCQRAAFLSILLETAEVRACEGHPIDLGSHIQAMNALTGILKSLGLEKRVKNVTDLKDYLKTKESA